MKTAAKLVLSWSIIKILAEELCNYCTILYFNSYYLRADFVFLLFVNMSNPYFRFKQFTVWHDRCAMKVGTDGVLLGAWAPVEGVTTLLDVGTGSGLVALMLAQRAVHARIVAVEIDPGAAGQAMENAVQSPWKDRIDVRCVDFNCFQTEMRFDLIVSNPPYFTQSLNCPDARRAMARHADNLSCDGLLERSVALLSPSGKIALVLPAEIAGEVHGKAVFLGLRLMRRTFVRTVPHALPKRVLLLFGKEAGIRMEDELVIASPGHAYTPQFVGLVKDFYLHL